ncbi:MAG: hypothetical protein NTU53_24005 [Planctomycetota bacterium]|nr:hypothetical protein [Planctomycetota bacterium]
MTQHDSGENQGDADDVQFEKVEYAAAGPTAIVCEACKQDIGDVYFTAGKAILCGRCRDGWIASQSSGSALNRFLGALACGLAAAVVGSLIWYVVRRVTDAEWGIVAIVVGLIVGAGVRKGSQMRGGWVYQTMAILLTYSAIVSQYVPDVFQALMKHTEMEQVATTQPALAAGTTTTQPAPAPRGDSQRPPGNRQDMTVGKAIVALLFLGAILFVIAFVAPILAGFSNIIGLLIIGFALYEAWKLNKRPQLAIAGPFAVGALPDTAGPTA